MLQEEALIAKIKSVCFCHSCVRGKTNPSLIYIQVIKQNFLCYFFYVISLIFTGIPIIDMKVRVFSNGPGDLGSIPG